MTYTTHTFNTKNTSVLIPVFTADSGERREEEHVKQMNGFYDELKRSVFIYTSSSDFPKGGKYFARAYVTSIDEGIEIKVIMRLRSSGKTVSSRTLTHLWKDGVVIKKIVN